ncbi:unnamed protein product [marine sediment metagenome]|uniref:Uncharacterized protein n=1 Tax=marine sediment metagenome TaxID=412755 RepID=X0W8J3_9ZZZZ
MSAPFDKIAELEDKIEVIEKLISQNVRILEEITRILTGRK